MTTLLIASLGFLGGVLTTGVALLAFTAWATRDLNELERTFYEAEVEKGNPYPGGANGAHRGSNLGPRSAFHLSLRR
jgi:hypothetical protein